MLCIVSHKVHTMTRVQILLSADEDRRLERLAKVSRESKSSVVRRAVNLLFRLESEGDEEPLLRLIGQAGKARVSDAARSHDRLLAEAELQRPRR